MSKEIDIVISRKKSGSTDGKPKRGVIDPRRKKDLGRRRLSVSGVTVYDMGQLKTDSGWSSIPFLHDYAPYYDGYDLKYGNKLTASKLRAFESFILSKPHDKFRPVGKADLPGGECIVGHGSTYRTQIDNEWQGIKISFQASQIADGIAAHFTTRVFCSDFNTNDDTPYTKITATNDPTAADIGLAISTNASLYLMPRLCNVIGNYTPGGLLDKVSLGYAAVLVPRFWNPSFQYTVTSDGPELVAAVILVKGYPGVKAYKYGWDGYNIDDIYEVPLSTFPDSGDHLGIQHSELPVASDYNPGYQELYLAGLLKQNGNTYYVWSNY